MSETNINDKTIFIPKSNGNDKLEKPITFHVQFLTGEEQTQMEFLRYYKETYTFAGYKIDSNYIFERAVTKIENFGEITTARQFSQYRGGSWVGKMINEVAKFVYESMEIDSKN